jgi:hypothetical protein
MKTIREGLIFFILGILFMVAATFVIAGQNMGFLITLLSVFLEPGGWFLFWQGLDLIIFRAREKAPELEFYKKMSRAEIIFKDY